jgi:hypothetical protein
MAIYWCGDDELPVCDVTGESVDECDHIGVADYDGRDEWDLAEKHRLEEADRD